MRRDRFGCLAMTDGAAAAACYDRTSVKALMCSARDADPEITEDAGEMNSQ